MSDTKRVTVKDLSVRIDEQEATLDAILAAVQGSVPAAPAVDPKVQALVNAGFSTEQAQALAAQAEAPQPVADAPLVLTSKDQAEVLIAQRGFIPVRGRVYAGPQLIEAAVQVLKTGTPKVVQVEGEHRTKAVAVWRTDDGKSVALQNVGAAN